MGRDECKIHKARRVVDMSTPRDCWDNGEWSVPKLKAGSSGFPGVPLGAAACALPSNGGLELPDKAVSFLGDHHEEYLCGRS